MVLTSCKINFYSSFKQTFMQGSFEILIKMIILGKVQFKHQVNIVVTANKDIGD
jgi:hypothetical protein